MQPLTESYEYCRELTQRTAHNFRYSFMTLPAEKRRAMEVLYAFNRITDDLGDENNVPLELKQARLASWHESLRLALGHDSDRKHALAPKTGEVGTFWDHPALSAIADMAERFKIPVEYLFAVIDGVESDLKPVAITTFVELEQYCFRVAGAVGLCCIHVWGFKDERAKPLAIDCGLAFQLTNILRDIAEDAELGRVYIPAEDLARFQYSREELEQGVNNDRFAALMKFEVERAKGYYANAEQLFDFLEPQGRRILRVMVDIYGGLLKEIERRQFDVFSQRVSLPKWKKLWYAVRASLSRS